MSEDYQPQHGTSEPASSGLSTQRAHPWRATVRTVAWYLLAVLAALPLIVPIVTEQLGGYLPARVVAALAWTAGLSAAVLAVVQRVVLLAPVAAILDRIGLGTGADGAPEH